ncbi:hypothetical protein GOP47_0006080 [Adiantum capillus-veneris]|uniref:Uncharacterized protein n=1 Tax=Adiantum capillus-veneris TaxID=13818 RepID=A0A9D4V2K7_ADICA|nr:hypothetical protein GOP47_0006080 [Adiantum capillus-veneris]
MDDPQDWGMENHALAPEHPDWIAEVLSPETLHEAPRLTAMAYSIRTEKKAWVKRNPKLNQKV